MSSLNTKASFEATLESIIGLIEVIGCERSDLLRLLFDMVSNSPFRFAIDELTRVLDTEEVDLELAFHRVSSDLDKLEKGNWLHLEQVLKKPNVEGMLALCRARRARVSGSQRNRRLLGIERRLIQTRDKQYIQRWIEEFIG